MRDLQRKINEIPVENIGGWQVDLYYAQRHLTSDRAYWILSCFGIFLTTFSITLTLLIANASFVAALQAVENSGLYAFTVQLDERRPSQAYERAKIITQEVKRVLGGRGLTVPIYTEPQAKVRSTLGEVRVPLLALPMREILANYLETRDAVPRFVASGAETCLVPSSFPLEVNSDNLSIIHILDRFSCQAFTYAKPQPRLASLFQHKDLVIVPLESLIASLGAGNQSVGAGQINALILINGNLSFSELNRIYLETELAVRKFAGRLQWSGEAFRDTSQTIDRLLGIVLLVGGLAWVVSATGIFSSTLLSIRQRTNEVGIRLAVGASPQNLRNQFIFEAGAVVLLGLLIGWVVATPLALVYAYFAKLPITLSFLPYYATFIGASLVVVLTVLIPLNKVSRLDPAGVIRSVR